MKNVDDFVNHHIKNEDIKGFKRFLKICYIIFINIIAIMILSMIGGMYIYWNSISIYPTWIVMIFGIMMTICNTLSIILLFGITCAYMIVYREIDGYFIKKDVSIIVN